MSYHNFNLNILIKAQCYSWRALMLAFALSSILYVLGNELAEMITRWSVVVLLIASVIKVVIMAEQFRRNQLYRHWMLCYTLVVILLLLFGVKYFMK